MAECEVRVQAADLEPFIAELFHRAGMVEEEAAFCAWALVQTNLWGVDSHGVLRVPVYVERLRKRAVNPRPSFKTVRGSMGLEVIDGDDGMGFLVGRAAMLRAIELARSYNVGMVAAVRSNHFGAAALYARLAVKQEMIGIAMTNVTPNMVAPGGSQTITGNNPLAIAVPTFGEYPFVLDIATSNVAAGKLLLAASKGDKIPLDWATDRQGRPTDDPAVGFGGFLLPMAGHKGLGLSYVIDILCGVITGGAFQYQLKSMYRQPDDPSLTGHMMIAIDPLALISREEMRARMTAFQRTVKEAPMWDSSREMLLPGEPEYRTAQIRVKQGIPLPANLLAELVTLGQEMGVSRKLPAI